jgi:hypothetical protein
MKSKQTGGPSRNVAYSYMFFMVRPNALSLWWNLYIRSPLSAYSGSILFSLTFIMKMFLSSSTPFSSHFPFYFEHKK